MLILTRRKGEKIQFGDDDEITAVLTVLEVTPTRVRAIIDTEESTSEVDLLVSHKRMVADSIYVMLRIIDTGGAKFAIYAPDNIKIRRDEIDDRRMAV